MSPSVIEISRLTIFSAVVLPHPEGPIRTQISPGGTVKLSFSTAACSRPGYRLTTSSNAISPGADLGSFSVGLAGLPSAIAEA